MQILKEEVKKEIIKAGKKEFYDYGFQGASMRKIVKKAGTTIGNFYNYFESKEQLFYEITEPVLNSFMTFIINHEEHEELNIELDNRQIKAKMNELLQNLEKIFEKEFIILIKGSKGTKYENIKDRIITELSNHFFKHMKGSGAETNQSLGYAVGTGFLEGLLAILTLDISLEEKKETVEKYILLYAMGMAKF